VVVVVAVLVLAVGPAVVVAEAVPLVLSVDHIMEDSLLPLEAAAVVVVVRGRSMLDLAKLH
tara:strand:+ start:85 stop:267 length:183 start_codon:yes stop_codon:yes gene_type:complete